jgi:hypothetical protein
MDEDGYPPSGENYIGLAGEVFTMQPEPITQPMQHAADL